VLSLGRAAEARNSVDVPNQSRRGESGLLTEHQRDSHTSDDAWLEAPFDQGAHAFNIKDPPASAVDDNDLFHAQSLQINSAKLW
jgi:hypothetical protein